MDATIVTLASGNKAVFFQEDYGIESFFITNNAFTHFLGGGLAEEAKRKEKVFSEFNNSIVEHIDNFSLDMMYNLDYSGFAANLASASVLLEFAFKYKIIVNDLADCNGTDSSAQSCSERSRYYRAVGLLDAVCDHKNFHLVLFIANHITIFGVNNFRKTFFHINGENLEDYRSDSYVSERYYYTRYKKDRTGFKAPAYYVRALVRAKIS